LGATAASKQAATTEIKAPGIISVSATRGGGVSGPNSVDNTKACSLTLGFLL